MGRFLPPLSSSVSGFLPEFELVTFARNAIDRELPTFLLILVSNTLSNPLYM